MLAKGGTVHPNTALLLAPCSLLMMAGLGLGGGIIEPAEPVELVPVELIGIRG